jgi:glycosyltransferase involved in cell wall biosynthesis
MTGKPRILILLGSIPLYGLELATIECGRMLSEANAEVLFVTNAHWGHQAVNRRLEALGLRYEGLVFFGALERGASLRRIGIFLRFQVTESVRLLRIFSRFGPTHIQITELWDFVNFLPAFLIARKVPLILVAHNALDVRHWLLKRAWRALRGRAWRIVAVSHYLAAHYAKLGARSEQLEVIPNSVPGLPRNGRVVEPPPRGDAVLRLIYVGQIAAHKGVGILLEAVLDLATRGELLECLVVGGIETDWARTQIERVTRHPAARRVVFAGYVADPTAWYASCDVHVAPSICHEAFGQAVAEAKAAGKPSVVFDDGALKELVSDGVDGFVCPAGDTEALKAALLRFLRNPMLAGEQGKMARESIATLGLDRQRESWAQLYGLSS